MSRGALHMCGVSLSKFPRLDLGDLVVSGSFFPLGQKLESGKSELRG
jgi:hypothetical protein